MTVYGNYAGGDVTLYSSYANEIDGKQEEYDPDDDLEVVTCESFVVRFLQLNVLLLPIVELTMNSAETVVQELEL